MKIDLFKHLNKEQNGAVGHTGGASVILAGAGSGKTRVLVHKVLNLILNHKVDPDNIVMITFTNKAANEMKERIKKAVPPDSVRSGLGYVGTFHSFCCQILRRQAHNLGLEHSFSIYDDDDQTMLLKAIIKKLDNKKYTASYYSNRISAAKNQLITPDRYLSVFSDWGAPTVAQVYTEYQKELNKNMAVDFDDLIMRTVELFTKHPEILDIYQERYRYILVDEFQDTNYSQYVLTRILGRKYGNVTVVGDFSQSIYSWRGADIRNLEKFQEDFSNTKVFYLEHNYRSTQTILDFAYEIISQNQLHPILKLQTDNVKGEDITYYEADNEEDEAIYIANRIEKLVSGDSYSSFAVLYRTNAQSRAIEEAFLHYGIPYTLYGGTRFYDRREIKDILSYLRLIVNPQDEMATDRIKKLGKKYWTKFKAVYDELHGRRDEISSVDMMDRIFQDTGYLDMYNPEDQEDYSRLENIKELKSVAMNFPKIVDLLQQVALVESEYFEGERKQKNRDGVRLMTMHQAKGLEFPYVFIAGVEEGILPHSRSMDDMFQLEEERRLFYVGITRAREKLFITHARRRFIFGRRNESVKSRFIGGGREDIIW